MKRISSKLYATLTVGLLSLGFQAQAACNPNNIVGKWGFSGQGREVSTGAEYTQVYSLSLKADGTGVGVMNRSVNGVYYGNIPVTITNITIDNVTCMGTLVASHAPHGPMTKTFVLTDDGKELNLIDASGGFTSLSIGKKL